ncbi:hypothetical protein STRIP9103_04097, partial [Streptomyces ipomoeae 91-03]
MGGRGRGGGRGVGAVHAGARP